MHRRFSVEVGRSWTRYTEVTCSTSACMIVPTALKANYPLGIYKFTPSSTAGWRFFNHRFDGRQMAQFVDESVPSAWLSCCIALKFEAHRSLSAELRLHLRRKWKQVTKEVERETKLKLNWRPERVKNRPTLFKFLFNTSRITFYILCVTCNPVLLWALDIFRF